mgnify:CR=1 FL=1
MNAPASTLPVAKRPLRQVANVRELLVNDQAKQQLASVAAAHMRPSQMLRLMANAIRTTPQLAECDPLSLLGCMMTCASLGLMPNTPLFQSLCAVIMNWQLPLQLFRDLLDAFAQDVVQKRYIDYPELLDYCRRSANPIGRLLVHLTNRASEENLYRSDCICTALQLINFWQDIAVDWQKDRVYLPQTDLTYFGISEAQIAESRWTTQWEALLAFQTQRARELMLSGTSLVHQLPGRMGWEIRFTVQGGLRILEKIDQARGDVFRQRPLLRPADWLLIGSGALFM